MKPQFWIRDAVLHGSDDHREKAGSVIDTGGSGELDHPAEPVGVEAEAASTGLYITNHTMDKHYTLPQWCKALVPSQRATQVMSAENAFKEWHKGHLSAAERQELEMFRRQAKDGTKTVAAKTSAVSQLRWSSSRTTMPPPPGSRASVASASSLDIELRSAR